jgi:hypothetical protein
LEIGKWKLEIGKWKLEMNRIALAFRPGLR